MEGGREKGREESGGWKGERRWVEGKGKRERRELRRVN